MELFQSSFLFESDEMKSGPRAIGLDVSMPEGTFLCGIPEHAAEFEIGDTFIKSKGWSEPYRLFNLDRFKYSLNSTASLYGSVPFLMGQTNFDRNSWYPLVQSC